MLKKIEALNRKIEALSKEKTKLEGQKGVWEERLLSSIKEYASAYGVDLSGKSFKDIEKKLEAEIQKVREETTRDYERANKMVTLIDSGDIKGAWKVIGVDLDAKESETVEEESIEQEGLQGVDEVVLEVENGVVSDDDFFGSDIDSFEDDLDAEGDVSSKSKVTPVFSHSESVKPVFSVEDDDDSFSFSPKAGEKKESVTAEPKFGGFALEDDDDDEIAFTPKKTNINTGKSFTKGKMVLDDEDDDDDFVTPDTVEVDEDDDDNPFGSFGGFGAILSGSKYSPRK